MKKQYSITALILICVAIIIALFSYNTVWLGDEINYAFDFREEHRDEIVSSFSQIIQSMNAHYMTMNGRHIPHILVQLFCGMWGHLPFAIANGIAYVVFIIALCKLCYVKLDNIKGVLTVTLFALIVFQTKMWPSCQIGYIWTYDLAMIFLIVFFSKRVLNKWWQILLLGIFSLIAGNGNESLTLGISGALIIFWCKNIHKMTIRQYVMMVCFGIGTLAICLSPGAYNRASTEINNSSSIIGFCYSIFNTMPHVLIASYVFAALLIWNKYYHKRSFKNIYSHHSFYFNIWIIMFLFNIIIGFDSNRQAFGVELAAIIISIRLLKNHTFNRYGITILFICLLTLYKFQYTQCQTVKTYYNEIIKQYIESTDGKIYLDINLPYAPYSMAFSPGIPTYEKGTNLYDNYKKCDEGKLARWLMHNYPNKNIPIIIPTRLKDYKDRHLDNAIYEQWPGVYLVIQDKQHPKKLYVDRHIDTPILQKYYDPLEVDLTQYILCESTYWVASYVHSWDYTILQLSQQTFYFSED